MIEIELDLEVGRGMQAIIAGPRSDLITGCIVGILLIDGDGVLC